MSALPAALLNAKTRVREHLRDDPRLVGVGVGKVDGRLGIVVYGTMDALDFSRVGDVPVVLRHTVPPVPQVTTTRSVSGAALALGIVGIGVVASLVGHAGSGNADVRRDPQTDTPAFRAWFKNSRVVDPDNGRPRVVYHGTTHDFDAFDLKNANVENHHGRAFYFTTARDDVGSNYATRQGPDLTSRIENRMDELSSADDQDALVDAWAKAHPGRKKDAATLRRAMTNGTVSTYQSVGYKLMREVWRWHAEQRLVGSHGGAVLPVYLSIQNPVDLRQSSPFTPRERPGHNGGMYFPIDTRWIREGRPDEEARQTGPGVKVQAAIRAVAARYWDRDLAEEILGKLDTDEGFSARDLESAVRGMGSDWMSDDGDPGGPGEFLRQVYERAGFDGIVEDAYAAFGNRSRPFGKFMAGIQPGTEHWVAFRPSQVKSAIGNRGTFSARSPKLSANRGSATKSTKPRVQAWPPPVPKNNADIFASIYRWTSGRCLEFAQALHERYGYPLVVITPAYNRDYAIHVVCAVPGGYVDALGFRTEAALRKAYARELAWDAKNDRKYGYDIPPEQETLLFRQLPLVEIEEIMDTEVRPNPQYLEPGTVLMVDEAAAIIAANPERYGPGRGSAARSAKKPASAKRPAKSAPRYVMLPRGGNGPGITRFLPDEHVLSRKVDWVDPKSLEVDPLDAERDPERLKSVLQMMRDGLPLPALIVYEGEQVIWDGHHRQLAALKLKIPLVPVQWLRYEPSEDE